MYAHFIHIWSLIGQKRELDSLEVELQTYESCHVSLDKQSVPLTTAPSLQHHSFFKMFLKYLLTVNKKKATGSVVVVV